MPPHGATADATETYARRFRGKTAAGTFRRACGLMLSSIGLGTYLGREDESTDLAYRESIAAAVAGGINVIDTAINYRMQRSERAVGQALTDLLARGFRRQEIVLATKGGYVPSADPVQYFDSEIVSRGLAQRDDLVAGCHSIAPGYIRHQLEASLHNLGVDAIDVYYLHNPEQQLETLSPPEFLGRIRLAFEELEKAVARGLIAAYGTATWNGYRVDPDQKGALSLSSLVEVARSIAGEGHHFRVVQLPFNLAMTEALGNPNQTIGNASLPVLSAAEELGIAVMASASILQGRLTRGLPPLLSQTFAGLRTDAQRALQFVRSTPGVTTALVGMSRASHVRENLGVLSVPPAPRETVLGLFQHA